MLDLVIVGLGPAGIAASLYAARQNLNFVAISKDIGGLANMIPNVKTYLGYHYISGFDLVHKFQEHLEDYKVNMKSEIVVKIRKSPKSFVVSTDKGEYETKSVLIASGRGFKRLGLPGEELENRGVSFCAACDGPLFKNKTVAIIGGGKSGLLSTLFIEKIAKKIYLIEKQPQLGGTEVWREAVEGMKKVTVMTDTETSRILGKDKVNGIEVKRNGRKETIKVDGVFVEVGYVPHTGFAKGLVKVNNRDEIIIDKENNTSTAGVFAAGDCTDIKEKQVMVAVGEGAKALLRALEYLEEIKR